MKFLETSPDMNYRRMRGIYAQLRQEVLDQTGQPLDGSFDNKVRDLLRDIRNKEREVRAHLVRMNLVQHMKPHGVVGKWNGDKLTQKASEYLQHFSTKNQELNKLSLDLVKMLSHVAYVQTGN